MGAFYLFLCSESCGLALPIIYSIIVVRVGILVLFPFCPFFDIAPGELFHPVVLRSRSLLGVQVDRFW